MGADSLVTVRMPTSLVQELKLRTTKEHYTDFSEQLRSIIRKQSLAYLTPGSRELGSLKEELKAELKEEHEEEKREALLSSLRELLRGEAQ